MERGLIAPLSPHEEVTLRRIALGISKASHLPQRDVAHLIRLCLVADNEGRLSLTDIGRERYRALPKAAGMTPSPMRAKPQPWWRTTFWAAVSASFVGIRTVHFVESPFPAVDVL